MHPRRALPTALLLLLLASTGAVASDPRDAIVGDWLTKEGKSVLRIERTDSTCTAAIVRLKEPNAPDGTPKLDHRNPDPSLRARPLLGLVILRDLRFEGDGNWSRGRIYDPESGNTYRCKATLDGPDRIRMHGYIGIALVGRTEVWRRVRYTAKVSP